MRIFGYSFPISLATALTKAKIGPDSAPSLFLTFKQFSHWQLPPSLSICEIEKIVALGFFLINCLIRAIQIFRVSGLVRQSCLLLTRFPFTRAKYSGWAAKYLLGGTSLSMVWAITVPYMTLPPTESFNLQFKPFKWFLTSHFVSLKAL